MVIYENIQVIESAIEVYGNMRVIERPYYCMILCKSYTVPYYGQSIEKHTQSLLVYDKVLSEQKFDLKYS